MHYAFVDESGTEAMFGRDRFLVIALLATERPREIQLAVSRARHRYGRQLGTAEMKAKGSPPAAARSLLAALAGMAIDIMTVVVDKGAILRPPAKPVVIYHAAAARTIQLAAARHPELEVFLDKRYTTPRQRRALEEAINGELTAVPEARVRLSQANSIETPGLQAADFIAWAIFQRYVRRDPSYYKIIADKIVTEEIISRQLW